MIKTALLVSDGCFASTVYGLVDALGCAEGAASEIGQQASFETRLVSQNGEPVWSSSQHYLKVDDSAKTVGSVDVVVAIPTIPPTARSEEVSRVLEPLDGLTSFLVEQLAFGAVIASSCTGSFLLAEAGLLNGKRATTHWRAAEVFRQRYPDVLLQARDLITDDGSLMCGGGAASHVDLALHLIRRFCGEAIATHCAHSLVADPGRSLQSPYALMTVDTEHGDRAVAKAQHYIASHFDKPIFVESLAERLHLSERTFARRFKKCTRLSLRQYIQGVRIDAARMKLATTDMPVQSIVSEVGYLDVSSFSRLFKTKTGLTMHAYRERFRAQHSLA